MASMEVESGMVDDTGSVGVDDGVNTPLLSSLLTIFELGNFAYRVCIINMT